MSKTTELTLFEDELAKMAVQAVADSSSGTAPTFLSTKGGQLTYKDSPIVGNSLNVVILASPIERLFYSTRYDANKRSGPTCSAMAVTSIGMKPHSSSAEPQHATCAGCPRDQWGSSLSGTAGKACAEKKRLLLMTADSVTTPENVAMAEVVALRTPVTSGKPFDLYLQKAVMLARRPLSTVITKISLVPDPKNQFRLQFDYVKPVDDMALVKALLDRAAKELSQTLMTVGVEEEVEPSADSSSKF